jgi:hypothetical protein
MNPQAFWDLIERTKEESRGNVLLQADLLQERVAALHPDEIRSFSRHVRTLHHHAYRMPLWDEVTRLAGWCSDDGFEYFRAWLMMQGEKVFSMVVAQPKTYLSEFFDPQVHECEEFLYVADQAYEQKTGQEMPDTIRCPVCTEEVPLSEVIDHPALGEVCQWCAHIYAVNEAAEQLEKNGKEITRESIKQQLEENGYPDITCSEIEAILG